MRRVTLLAALLFSVGGLASPAAHAQDDVPSLLNRLEDGDDKPEFWETVARLEGRGREVLQDVEEGLRRANPYVRIGCSKYLFSFGQKAEATAALLRVIQGENLRAASAAANLLANLVQDATDYGDAKDLAAQLKKRLADVTDAQARIAFARALYGVEGGASVIPLRTFRELLKSPDPDVQNAAALALAEMKEFPKNVVDVLHRIARTPGERGRLAAAYLALKDIGDEINRDAGRRSFTGGKYALLDEILERLRAQYVDPDRIKEKDMIEAAAKGLASLLDPYTAYLDEKDLRALNEGIDGKYGGIGARVAMRKDQAGNAWLTIERPIYSGPAYRAGLRSMDRIVEIEGEPSANRDLTDLVSRLKGDPGHPVKFKVYRRGWKEPHEYELIREQITVETVLHEMLPGNVGYLHLTTFGPQSAPGTEEALRDLEGQGMKALILDLRSNSGGLLKAAVDVAEKFLPRNSLVVRVLARNEKVEEYTTQNDPHPNVPMVVLIDGASASASEILAGALQDHKRAVCVGERSYGKGSVQQIPDLKSTPARDALRLTIAKYYLPSGRSPQKEKDAQTWGVDPDVKAEATERDYWKDAAYEKIRQSGKVDDYIKAHAPQHKALFRALAEDDGADPGRYPDFPKLLASLDPPLNRQLDLADLRELLRDGLRRWAADERGKDFNLDVQLDSVLQRGIMETLKRAGVDYKTVPAYTAFAEKPAAPEKPAENAGQPKAR